MRWCVFITIIFVIITLNTKAQYESVHVKGYASEYIGKSIVFFSYLERQFDSRTIIDTIQIDTTGYFSFAFNSSSTQVLYCETVDYTGYFYAEKGRNYIITLPPILSAELQNSNNPFLISPLWHMMPDDSLFNGLKDLNYAIQQYDDKYEPFAKSHLLKFYDTVLSKIQLDSFLQSYNFELNVTDSAFFSDYLLYKKAQLELLVKEYERQHIYASYFLDRPLPMNNPAFWEFFRLYFDRYISSLSDRKEFNEVYSLIGGELYNQLTILLKNDPVLKNDTIRELLLLNELYQGFYEKKYPLDLALNLIDTIQLKTVSSLIQNVADKLSHSITSLQKGYYPPSFILKSPSDKKYSLEDFKGKYLYIGFCSLENLGCLKELEYLKYQNSKYSKYLQIVIVVPENEKDNINSFNDLNSISWPILFSEYTPDLFRKFKIKTFPLFYLIDKEGKFLLSPSPLPSENFEQVLFQIMHARGEI